MVVFRVLLWCEVNDVANDVVRQDVIHADASGLVLGSVMAFGDRHVRMPQGAAGGENAVLLGNGTPELLAQDMNRRAAGDTLGSQPFDQLVESALAAVVAVR